MSAKQNPKVTVICWTYNQEKFIRQTLDGFLMQQTDFPFEIIVHDDASTDGTTAIIREYEQKYPDVVKPMYRQENQFSKGTGEFIDDTFRAARGKYIAICEGDDYWTDPEKLQLQADYLDEHPDYALCFHPVRVVFEDDSAVEHIYPDPTDKAAFTVKRLLKQNFIQTNSVMYRAGQYQPIPGKLMPRDWYLHLYFAQFGKIGFINRVMSVYRRHQEGVWRNSSRQEFWQKNGLAYFEFFAAIHGLYASNPKYRPIIETSIIQMFNRLITSDKQYGTQYVRDALRASPELGGFFIRKQDESLQSAAQDLLYKDRVIGRTVTDISRTIERELETRQSKSFVLGYMLLHPWTAPRKLLGMAKRRAVAVRNAYRNSKDLRKVNAVYRAADDTLAAYKNTANKKLAVVLHLYYPELWPYFKEKLSILPKSEFDLFVSIPDRKNPAVEDIMATYPSACIVRTPNRGRDVLPFVRIATALRAKKYQYVLKMHSKKSKHRDDGDDWLREIVDSLLPKNPNVLKSVISTLDKPDTGIVGPRGQYVSFAVNYESNKQVLRRVVDSIKSEKHVERMDGFRHHYGFFAGTMFWLRLDAIAPILDQNYTPESFDREAGQVDATLAHAIERLMCLLPEFDGRKLYDVNPADVCEIGYETYNIPAWADIYPGNILRNEEIAAAKLEQK